MQNIHLATSLNSNPNLKKATLKKSYHLKKFNIYLVLPTINNQLPPRYISVQLPQGRYINVTYLPSCVRTSIYEYLLQSSSKTDSFLPDPIKAQITTNSECTKQREFNQSVTTKQSLCLCRRSTLLDTVFKVCDECHMQVYTSGSGCTKFPGEKSIRIQFCLLLLLHRKS